MIEHLKNQNQYWEDIYAQKGVLWRREGFVGIPLEVKGKVLELGCGNGKMLLAFMKTAKEVHAIDVSPTAVKLAKEITESKGYLSNNIIVADVRKLPYDDNFFDMVMVMHVIEHLVEPDRKGAAAEIMRVVKPEGRIYVRALSRKDFRANKGVEVEPYTRMKKDKLITHFFTFEELDELFRGLKKTYHKAEHWTVTYDKTLYQREKLHVVYEKLQL